MKAEAKQPNLDELLEVARQAREAIPEPSLEEIEAFAAGKLPSERSAELETLMRMSPELRYEVDAIRNPDLSMRDAIQRGLARGRRLEEEPSFSASILERLKEIFGKPRALTAGLALALALLMVNIVYIPLAPEEPGTHAVDMGEVFTFGHAGPLRAPKNGYAVEVPAGQSIFIKVYPAQPFVSFMVLEVAGQEVRDPYEMSLTGRGDYEIELDSSAEPDTRYLINIYLSESLPAKKVATLLQGAVKSGRLSLDASKEKRKAMVEASLKEVTSGKVKVTISDRFYTHGP